MPDIEIRSANFDDAEAIAGWQVDMARETEDKPLDRALVLAGVRAGLSDEAKGFYLIGTCEGEAAASMLVTREWSDWRNGWFWWIQSVFVDARFRRRGLYRAMHDAVRERARDAQGVIGLRLYVERENERAMSTYLAMGMHETVYRLFEEEL